LKTTFQTDFNSKMDKFDAEMMNTSLEISISGERQNYARSAALACFSEAEALDGMLTMYRFGSDISCVNSSDVGAITPLTREASDCMTAAFAASVISGGAIDVCMGEYFLKAKNDKVLRIRAEPRRGKFELDSESLKIRKISDGRIDLGCIGKGFAVDAMVKKLKEEWEIKNALVSFGASSIYAFGKKDGQPWELSLSAKTKIAVDDFAIGASGTAVEGRHIIDARTGKIPESQPFRTWAFCADAWLADAMSTAFMVLSKGEIAKICREEKISAAIQPDENSEVEFID